MVASARFAGVEGTLQVQRQRPGLVLITLSGLDTGELGRAPFLALEDELDAGAVEIFIDARQGRPASVEVTGEWAMFFHAHRAQITRVHLLTSPRLPVEHPELVRSYAILEDRMDLVTDAAAFERTYAERVSA